jgi:hypothetical protein
MFTPYRCSVSMLDLWAFNFAHAVQQAAVTPNLGRRMTTGQLR